jgi:superfamily II DNA or RNA helicase
MIEGFEVEEERVFELRDYQRRWIQKTAEEREKGFTRLLLDAVGGAGKCLGKGTPVLMFDGSVKNVEDVRVCDLVMGPDSMPRKVVSTCTGIEDLYRIKPTKGAPYVVNKSHILSLKSSSGKARSMWLDGTEYRHGEIINIPVAKFISQPAGFHHTSVGWRAPVDSAWGSNLHPDMPPYILGFWLGDGTTGHPTFTVGDPEPIQAIHDWAKSIDCATGLYTIKTGCCTLRVRPNKFGPGRNRMTRALAEIGVLNRKHIPDRYKICSRQDRLHLLAGLMDSDGSVSNAGFDFISISESLSNDVAFVSRSVGLAAYVKPCEKRCQNGNGGTYYRVSISGDCSIIPCKIARKKATPRRQCKNVLHVGITAEPIGVGEYFGFQLEGPDKLFLLGDFTVTHNTTYAGALMRNEWRTRQGRSLILENRQQLVEQTAKRIRDETGMEVDIEMGDHSASPYAQVVVASVASLGRINRLTAFSDNHFALVFADEAHNSVSNLFLRVMRYFHYGASSLAPEWVQPKDGEYQPHACIIGITATPDSHGKKNLGNFYQKFVDRYSYLQAIDDGWLVGIKEVNIPVKIDTRKFRKKTTGHGMDFSPEDESAAIIPIIEELAEQIVSLASNRKTMCFLPSKECAMLMTDALNRRGLKSLCVLGEHLDRDEKTDEFRDHGPGICLSLCAMFVEGTDFPDVDTVAWMRATLSPSFYKQGIYRCSRTLPGLVRDEMGAEGRRAAIAASSKPWSLVISPFFVSDKIDLMSVVDLFVDAGLKGKMKRAPADFTDAAKTRDFIKALEKAADKHQHRQPRTIDPITFSLSIGADRIAAFTPADGDDKPATREELDLLLAFGIDTTKIKSSSQAQRLISTLRERDRLGLASPKALGQLTLRLGWPEEKASMMKAGQAGAIIGRGIRYRG